ncbi:hypothetical protein [Chitinophaga solisilvae]|uniref:Uncharacterized protein n=1 Tax=Chitinophaga solisilvae TaxID=1233460 RepID=A0A9Q5D8M7_9BACT|nr:hypothetical protein [Chitinophaga solisilvae]NSL88833.1 hypothetical protein [Chitinophaga solisilvae]
MRKWLQLFVCISIFFCSGCTKEEEKPDTTEVVFQLESRTDIPFGDVEYGEGTAPLKKWTVSGVGTFEQTMNLKTGSGIRFSARHPSSDKWKISVRSTDGNLLIEGAVKASPGATDKYYADIRVTIN